MKRSIALLLLSLPTLICATAQTPKGVRISEVQVHKSGDELTISFHAAIEKKAASGGCTQVLMPTLTTETQNRTLPFIAVQGSRAAIAAARHDRADKGKESLSTLLGDETFYLRPGKEVAYFATVPYQAWMTNASLKVSDMRIGCGNSQQTTNDTLLTKLEWLRDTVYIKETVHDTIYLGAKTLPATASTGNKLASRHNFVVPASEFRQNAGPTEAERRNALFIYFPVGHAVIDPAYEVNRATLDTLMSVIHTFERAQDSRISKVLIAGFTSPEGNSQVNQRLGQERADAMKNYILQHSKLNADNMAIFNGATDWQGLRMLVEESNMLDKQKIIDIIDHTPIWDSARNVGRLGTLMRLDDGKPYQYIKTNFFPRMRNAAYIRIYFEDK
ncbi:MAG: OmpA family protein [Prevotellaceae bacterium]|jgi:outer membrane protein OmpA-like peptidoglycan-associated protein|nr:OmpA family protein [Prevotellaceae bacterium]